MASKLEKYQIVRIRRERGILEPATVIEEDDMDGMILVQTESGVKIVDREDIET